MRSLPEQISELDRVIHEPARLAILTVLAGCDEADFTYLLRVTGLTNGNLSTHLSRLADAKLVAIHKQFVRKRPQTVASLTELGRSQIERHWRQLKELRKQASAVHREKVRETL
jgi:DNA-binding MarR family transcriptional regulator